MIVYAKFNHGRKAKYRLITTIEKTGKSFRAKKKAASTEGLPFLKSMVDSYNKLSNYEWPFKLLEPKKEGDTLVFNFVEGKSLDAQLFEALLKRKKEEILNVFKKYKELLAKIEVIEIKPGKEFEKYFGNNGGEIKKEKCLKIGLLDLILENVFEKDKGDFEVIDYEWVFPFPIPINYVSFRTIVNSYDKYRHYNIADILPIKELFKFFNINDNESKKFLEYDRNFMMIVHKGKISGKTYISNYKNIGKYTAPNYIKFLESEKANIERELAVKNDQLEACKKELNSIKFSRTWRMREKVTKYRRKNG